TQASLAPVAFAAAARSPSVRTVVVVDGLPADAPAAALSWEAFNAVSVPGCAAARPAGIDIDLAMLVYTWGSTGAPGGVMMAHKNLGPAASSSTTYVESDEDDVVLGVLRLSFAYGL